MIDQVYQHAKVPGRVKAYISWQQSEFSESVRAFEDSRPAGIMELGVLIEARKLIYDMSNKLKIKETKDFVHIKPQILKCRIKSRNLTKSNLLRIPFLVRFVA